MADPGTLPKKDIVLVVDDEQTVLRVATSALANAGFRAVVAENGFAGLDSFMQHADEICLSIIDVVMPCMDGVLLADRIVTARPDAKILLMTGYSDRVVTNSRNFPLIRKPFLPERLISEARRVMGS